MRSCPLPVRAISSLLIFVGRLTARGALYEESVKFRPDLDSKAQPSSLMDHSSLMKRLVLFGLLATHSAMAVAPEDLTAPGKPPRLHLGVITTTDGNLYDGFSFHTTRGWRYVIESSENLVDWIEEPSIYGLGQQQTLLMRETGLFTVTPPPDATPAPSAPANSVLILLQPAASPATGIVISWPSLAGGSSQVKHFPSLTMDAAWTSLPGYVRRLGGYDFQIASPPMSQTPPTGSIGYVPEDAAMLTAFEANFATMNQDVIDEVARTATIPKPPMVPGEKRFWRVRIDAPDTDLDGTPDWLEYGQMFGEIPAPGGIGGAAPAPADPFSADANNNGIADGAEKDSDGDDLADDDDIVPGDPLIDWGFTPPFLFAAWPVEPPSGKSFSEPIQINDLGDVLFRDFIWSQGVSSPLSGTARITNLLGVFLDDNGNVYAKGALDNLSALILDSEQIFRLGRNGGGAQSIIDSSKTNPVFAGIAPQRWPKIAADMLACRIDGVGDPSFTWIGGTAIEASAGPPSLFTPWNDGTTPEKIRYRWNIASDGTTTVGAGEDQDVITLVPGGEVLARQSTTNKLSIGSQVFDQNFDRVVKLPSENLATMGGAETWIKKDGAWSKPKALPNLVDFATVPGFGLFGYPEIWQNGRRFPFLRCAPGLDASWKDATALLDTTRNGWTLALRRPPNTSLVEPPDAVLSCLSFSVEGATPGSGVDNASIDGNQNLRDPNDAMNKGRQTEFWVMVPVGGSKTVRIRSGASPKTPIALSAPHLTFEPATLTSSDQQVTLTANGVTEDLEEPITIRMGNQDSLNTIFKVKFLKERTVTVRVWLIKSEFPNKDFKEVNYNPGPTEPQMQNYLESVFGPQLNVKFKVKFGVSNTEIHWDMPVTGTGDGSLASGTRLERSAEQKLITEKHWDKGADINVYWVGSGKMHAGDTSGGISSPSPTERMAWLVGTVGTTPLLLDGVIHTMAHEVGHVMMGNDEENVGHPDEKTGPAPLPDSRVNERLMLSGKKTPLSATPKRLVKAEWDAIQAWLIVQAGRDGRTSPSSFQ